MPLPVTAAGVANPQPGGDPDLPLEAARAPAQSLAGVACSRLLTWSKAPLPADTAELEPRALMTAAPRFWHCGTKVFSSHGRSVMTSVAGRPLIFAFVKSGYCVLL